MPVAISQGRKLELLECHCVPKLELGNEKYVGHEKEEKAGLVPKGELWFSAQLPAPSSPQKIPRPPASLLDSPWEQT